MANPEESKRLPAQKFTPQLRFIPDGRLGTELQRFFIQDDLTTNTAQQGPFLYSGPIPTHVGRAGTSLQQRGKIVSAELSNLGRTIRHRSRMHHTLAKRLQVERSGIKQENISLKMDVILDEITAIALHEVMPVKPDLSIETHLEIRRQDLVKRDEFLAACKNLYERILDEDSPLGVDIVELVQNQRLR